MGSTDKSLVDITKQLMTIGNGQLGTSGTGVKYDKEEYNVNCVQKQSGQKFVNCILNRFLGNFQYTSLPRLSSFKESNEVDAK